MRSAGMSGATLRAMAVAFVVVFAGLGARAEDTAPAPEALTAAKDLFAILSPDMTAQLATQMTNAFWPAVEQQAHAEKIDDGTIGELRKEFDRIQLAFLNEALKDAPAVYARHFTVGELNDLTAFYRSPTGAKALREMPLVMGEFTALLVPRLQDVQHQIGDAFNTILRAHGYVK